VDPPSEIFTKLVDKNATKTEKGFLQPLNTLPPSILQKPHGLSPWFLNHVHLWKQR
jgi:hypothetical protein